MAKKREDGDFVHFASINIFFLPIHKFAGCPGAVLNSSFIVLRGGKQVVPFTNALTCQYTFDIFFIHAIHLIL